jgi:quercetin dioxygenase-like cupin family protein
VIATSLSELPWESVSHNPEIKKQVFLRNGDLGPITQLAQAVFQPGDIAPGHAHLDMGEVFLVLSGTLTIKVDGETSTHTTGTCLSLPPNEHHELSNQGDVNVVLLTLGVRMA